MECGIRTKCCINGRLYPRAAFSATASFLAAIEKLTSHSPLGGHAALGGVEVVESDAGADGDGFEGLTGEVAQRQGYERAREVREEAAAAWRARGSREPWPLRESERSTVAARKPANSGCGRFGRERNSGWKV